MLPDAIDHLTLELPGLAAVPHVDEYFGVWAVHADRFTAMVRALDRFDVRAHLAQQPSAEVVAATEAGVPVLEGGIAVVELSGPLMKHVSSLSAGSSTVMARRRLRAAVNDPRVSGILLHIDSPGGTVAGTKDLADDVAAAAARKPLYAYIEDLGASAAYWIASQAEKVFTNQTGLVGSIGTYGVLYDLSKMAEQDGVIVHVVKAGEFKGAGVLGTPITDEQLAEAQRVVDELNAHFLKAVSKARNFSAADMKKLADGRVHVGVAAKKLGLVDGVATIDETLDKLRQRTSGRGARADADDLHAGDVAGETNPPETQAENADMTTANTTPAAATIAEIKAACPKAEPNWLIEQLEKGATIDQASKAYRENLEAQLAIRDEEHKALAAKLAEQEKAAAAAQPAAGAKPPGVPPLGNGGQVGASADAGDAVAAFNAAIQEKIKAGLDRAKAVSAVVAEDPELHQRFVAVMNAGAGPRGNRKPRSAA